MTSLTEPFIVISKLCKSYQEGSRTHCVLCELDAEFTRGEFTAILGKSGSGKSTLLNLISGIDRADSGEIWLNGNHLTAQNDKQLTLFRRKNIGFIFQFYNLIPTLSVLENVLLPAELAGKPSDEAQRRALELLAEVGLDDRLETFPDRLSGGEQQRVSIARALINDPLLVLADEPTGNLDEAAGKNVLTLLDRLTRQAGKNLLLVTHSLEAAGYADRIYSLREGKLEPTFIDPRSTN